MDSSCFYDEPRSSFQAEKAVSPGSPKYNTTQLKEIDSPIKKQLGPKQSFQYEYYESDEKLGPRPTPITGGDERRLLRVEYLAEKNNHKLSESEEFKTTVKDWKTRQLKLNAVFLASLLLLMLILVILAATFASGQRTTDLRLPRDCIQVREQSQQKQSGVYQLQHPTEFTPVTAFCEFDLLGGGWMVIQRRGQFANPIDYFHRNFEKYEIGFGELHREFWLGLKLIQALTLQREHELAIVLTELDEEGGQQIHALYDTFNLSDDLQHYNLTARGHSGTAGDALRDFQGVAFSAPDRDHDASAANCANFYQSGWWFSKCGITNLNGLNYNSARAPKAKGIVFTDELHPFTYSFAGAQMMIRPKFREQY